MIPDGLGGAFLTWRVGDFSCPWGFNDSVRVQRVAASGHPLWTADGVLVAGKGTQPAITSDGSGGSIVIWKHDPYSSNYGIDFRGLQAQRFDANGLALWPVAALVSDRWETSQHECNGGLFPIPKNPMAVPDGAGGAIAIWQANGAVRAQRITATGEALWGSSGKMIGYPASLWTWMNAVPDGNGGIVAVWRETNGYHGHTVAQHVGADGSILWGDSLSALPIGPGFVELEQPAMAPDDSGGFIITWADYRAVEDIHAQRVDALGRIRWTEGGITVCTRPQGTNAWVYPVIVADGDGGALIAWPDSRASEAVIGPAIYGQRISRSGMTLWAENGIVLSGAPDTVSECSITSDDHGGAIVAWTRWLHGYRSNQIWAQHVDPNGHVRWGEAGRMVASTAPSRRFPQLVPDGVGGAIVAWESGQNPFTGITPGAIEAQRISSSGELHPGASNAAGSITAMPNPVRDAAMLRLVLHRSGRSTVAIHDLSGRRVRLLFEGDLDAGERWLTWNGRDDSGNRVRPGVYFARVTNPGTRSIGRIVLLP